MRLRYVGPVDNYWPTLGLTPTPGDVHELAEHPGPGWLEEPIEEPKPVKADRKKETA